MKPKIQLFILLILFVSDTGFAQYPSHVKVVKIQPNKIISLRGNLAGGRVISDLSWASQSSVACFPATQNSKFTGNHILYAVELPKYSTIKIILKPKNKDANLSLYAYSVGATNTTSVVPNLSSCVSCEADYKWDRPHRGKTQDETRSVELRAINNPYKVIIGVAGADKLTTGGYTLSIELMGR